MKMITELYHGRIRPFEDILPSQELHHACESISRCIDALGEHLSGDDKILLEKISEISSEISMLTAEEYFTYGFETGASLTAEALAACRTVRQLSSHPCFPSRSS